MTDKVQTLMMLYILLIIKNTPLPNNTMNVYTNYTISIYLPDPDNAPLCICRKGYIFLL